MSISLPSRASHESRWRQAGILVSVALLLAAATLLLFTRFALPGGWRAYSVLTGSMEPAIPAGSLIINKAPPTPQSLDEQDIITFAEPGFENQFITHRVHEVQAEGGNLVFITKGDANEVPDSWRIPYGNIQGVYTFHLPLVGHVVEFMKSPFGLVIFVIVPVIVIMTDELRNIVNVLVEKRLKRYGDKPIASAKLPRRRETRRAESLIPLRAHAQTYARKFLQRSLSAILQRISDMKRGRHTRTHRQPLSFPLFSPSPKPQQQKQPAPVRPIVIETIPVDSIQNTRPRSKSQVSRKVVDVTFRPLLVAALMISAYHIQPTLAAFVSNTVTISSNSLSTAVVFTSPSPSPSPTPTDEPSPSPIPSPSPDVEGVCDVNVETNLRNENTGPGSVNENNVEVNVDCTVTEENSASVTNEIDITANTGGNTSSGNTEGGTTTTGSININLNSQTRVNSD